MAKIRLQIVLEAEEKEFLKKMAKGQSISIGEAVRRCINGVRMKGRTSVTEPQEEDAPEEEYESEWDDFDLDDYNTIPEELHDKAREWLKRYNPPAHHINRSLAAFMDKQLRK